MRNVCVLFIIIITNVFHIVSMEADNSNLAKKTFVIRYGTFLTQSGSEKPQENNASNLSYLSQILMELGVKITQTGKGGNPDSELQEVKLEEYTAMIKANKCRLYYRWSDISSVQVHNVGSMISILCKDKEVVGFDTDNLKGEYLWVDDYEGKAVVEKNSGIVVLEWEK